MKKSRVVSNALNNPKAGYSQPARLEPTVVWRRSRRLQLTALEQLSKVLEAKQESDPHTEKRTLPQPSFHGRPKSPYYGERDGTSRFSTSAQAVPAWLLSWTPTDERISVPGLPLTGYCLPLTAYYLLLTTYYLLLTTYYLLLTTYCLLLAAYCLPFETAYSHEYTP